MLGHSGIGIMRKINGNCICHNLKEAKFFKTSNFICTTCATGKLILRPSHIKIHIEELKFLERIQCDICVPIQSLCGPFRYFKVLIDASTLMVTCVSIVKTNHAFAKFMMQVIRLKTNFPKYQIQSIQLDNVTEFSS
jgi:hypothetical protein